MLSKAKPVNLLSNWSSRKTTNLYKNGSFNFDGVYNFLCNSFSNTSELPKTDESPITTESPDLPSWVKFSEKDNQQVGDSDDDFVLPTGSYWVDNNKVQDQRTEIKRTVGDIIDSDVDRISKILKNQFQSPGDVTEALNGSTANVSESFVDQILKRFSNDWALALGFFNWAKSQTGFEHSTDLYNSMVDILGKCKKFDFMWGLVDEMSRSEVSVTLVTMTKVFRRLAKACRYKDAIEAFGRVERFGVSKDAASMNALLDALVKENSVEHAQDVFSEFKNQISPNSQTFNILIHGWCKARQVEKARNAMGEMERLGLPPDVISYTCFIESYCREKDFRKVDAVLEEMQEKGCSPNSVTYTIVMHALGKAKEVNEALKVYEKMRQSGCVPDPSFYSSLIHVLSKAGRLKDAREVFDDMSKQGVNPDVLTYNTMITTACEHSQEENALGLLGEMEKSRCKPDLRTYTPLLKMCCRKKRMKMLSFLLEHLFENDVSLELGTYSLLVRGLCKCGELERACLIFEEMVLRGFVPMDCTSEMLRKELERKGMEKEKAGIHQLILKARSQ
ncbi:hypothetical protein U1Q18_034544 [Sarracenia purpurea var. burkii]